jgi:hypothetical protein
MRSRHDTSPLLLLRRRRWPGLRRRLRGGSSCALAACQAARQAKGSRRQVTGQHDALLRQARRSCQHPPGKGQQRAAHSGPGRRQGAHPALMAAAGAGWRVRGAGGCRAARRAGVTLLAESRAACMQSALRNAPQPTDSALQT